MDHVCASYIVVGVRALEGAHHSSETITVLASPLDVSVNLNTCQKNPTGFVVDEFGVGSTYRFGCSEEASKVCVVNATECD